MSALSKLYSKLAKEIESSKIKHATPEEWTNYLRNRGVKQEELDNFSKAMPSDNSVPFEKQDALNYFRMAGDAPVLETRLTSNPMLVDENAYNQLDASGMSIDEVDELMAPRYAPNSRSGQENVYLKGAPEDAYEELVLHSPWAEKLSHDPLHFTDIPGGDQNIAWLRYNLRQLDDGNNLFHLDELQSNRHQAGAKQGYKSDYPSKEDLESQIQNLYGSRGELQPSNLEKYYELKDLQNKLSQASPDAPFKGDNWKNLGLRRALLEAADRDADLFSWTPARIQEARSGDKNFKPMYDKYIPNQLRKDLKNHGVTEDMFTSVEAGGGPAIKDLPMPMSHLLSKPMFDGQAEDYVRLFDDISENPSDYVRHFESIGMPRSVAKNSVDDIAEFMDSLMGRQQHMSPEFNQEVFDKAIMDFAPNTLFNTNNAFSENLPAVRLTPEIRKSILEKGFPKYMLPLGAAGLSMEQEPVQEYAAGGAVKKAIEILKNPIARDVISLAKDAPDQQLRVMRSHPDTYYWPAYDAEHDGVRQLLGLPREYTGLSDILTYDKGKFHPEYNKSYIEDAAEMHGTTYEDERKDWMMKNFGLPALSAIGVGLQEDEQNYAAGGKVANKGAAALRELLENLHDIDPERIARAEDAGFNTQKIYLHGTDAKKDFKSFNPSEDGVWFTDSPEEAEKFAIGNNGRIIPVFAHKDYVGYSTIDDVPTSIDPNFGGQENFPIDDLSKFKSIFNDFTPESLASEKFAKGGKVAKQGTDALRELLENLHKTDPERMARAEAQGYDTKKIFFRGQTALQDFSDEKYPLVNSEGSDTNLGWQRFFTESPEQASNYTIGKGYYNGYGIKNPHVIPVFIQREGNISRKYNPNSVSGIDQFQKTIDNIAGDTSINGMFIKGMEDPNFEKPPLQYMANNGRDPAHREDFYPSKVRSVFANFDPEKKDSSDLMASFLAMLGGAELIEKEPQNYAAGGKVKLDPAKNRATTSDAIETFFRDYMDAISLAQSDEVMGNIGGLYAKTMRPDLFEDVDMRTLMEAAAANSEAERHRLEEEHPIASIAGMLASVPAYASFGGASLAGQMGANALLGGAYRYGDHEDPLDPTSIGIDLALPAAFRNLKRTAQGLALAAPAVGLSGDADLELSSLRDLAHTMPDNYRIRP